jgi:hypothetical protein
MIKTTSLIATMTFSLFFFSLGCASDDGSGKIVDPNAYLAKGPENKREINIRYSFMGHGEPGSLQLWRKRLYASRWLYVPVGESKWAADEIIVTTERGKLGFPYAISDLKGYVEIIRGTLIVDLQLPYRPDGKRIIDYSPFDQNGTYKITSRAAPPWPEADRKGRSERVMP